MQDDYRTLAKRFRMGSHLDEAQLLELYRFADEARNYALRDRVALRIGAAA